jgi:membrane protein
LATGGVVSVFGKFLSYGAIGSVMILLLWIFMACQVVFIGCEFSYVYAQLYGSRRGKAPPAEAGKGGGEKSGCEIPSP